MIDKKSIVDGIVFIDEDDPNEKIIFNLYTWAEMLKAIIVKYANKSESEAEHLVLNHPAVCGKIDDYMSVAMRSQEPEYDWAMMIVYGHGYWQKGIPSKEPEGFYEWDEQYRKDHHLAEFSIEFITAS
ncbi:hypothetical protein M5U04_21255 [Xenorhabdus sp. XENO-1]|uniref:hypothetical protein n=1 Tax=Xenorhabdus bovienii TaxID=40576 RepID=UPI0020CA8440|nr:hypothetical protein [Xenorhabdus bovienii]MCP9270522.1 hypothetical protein [Xenorhabdus bovienii subsp. africana]